MLYACDSDETGTGAPPRGALPLALLSLSGCALTDLWSAPQVVVQVRESREGISFTPDRARVGQRVRFQIEVTDNFQHEFEAKGTPIKDLKVEKGNVRSVDWTPTTPGTYEFKCDAPGHTEKGVFTVE